MRSTPSRLIFFILWWGAAASADSYQAPPVEPGFTPLFDGQELSRHFLVKGRPEGFQAVDGVIRGMPGGDRLISREMFSDFVLRLEWKVSQGGNSGVFLRVPSQEDGAPWESGFEVQISNEPRDEMHCTGSLYGVEKVRRRPDERAEVWHSFEITCLEKRITVKADGLLTIDARAEENQEIRKRPLRGYLGLQDSHAGPGSSVEFRNVRIQKLLPDGTVPGFTSLVKEERSWRKTRTGHGSGGRWTLEDGVWTGEQDPPGSGNGGILITEGRQGDFELILSTQADWNVDSGIFLRSTGSGSSYQIMVDHHQGGNIGGVYGEGIGGFNVRSFEILEDRTITPVKGSPVELPFDPKDWEKHWDPQGFNDVRSRIAGNPPVIDVWLNGVYLTHFQDDQKRLESTGHLGLQVHGGKGWPSGAKVRFKNIQVRELAQPSP
jgi:hypothetical protein